MVLVRVLYARATGLVAEDALITLRYADTLGHGLGCVFNAGERVLGTTTPLQALLLAPVARALGRDALIPAAVALGIAASGACAWLIVRLGRRLQLPDAVSAAAVL